MLFYQMIDDQFSMILVDRLNDVRAFKDSNLLLLKNILKSLRDKAFHSVRTHKILAQKLSEAKTKYS